MDASTTAMFMGTPMERAFASHEVTATFADSRVKVSILVVGAIDKVRSERVMMVSTSIDGTWLFQERL